MEKLYSGEYSFAEYYPSNNDGSVKKIAYYYKDKEDVVFDGNGDTLLFEKGVYPFIIDNCKNVTLKNFKIDFTAPFYLAAEILSADESGFVLRGGEELSLKNGELVSLSGGEKNLGFFYGQEYNSELKVPYKGSDFLAVTALKPGESVPEKPSYGLYVRVSETDDKNIRFRIVGKKGVNGVLHKGGKLVIFLTDRKNGAIYVKDSRNVKIENVTVYSSPAMGVICQNCENVALNRFVVKVKNDNVLVSANADAAHFVNCRGKISITDCVFYNMMDDAVNIHGIYGKVLSVSGKTAVIGLMHYQQRGVNFISAGDEISFLSSEDFSKKADYRAEKSVLSENKKYLTVTFEKELKGVSAGDVADNVTAMPEAEILRCKTGVNRPRGFLLTSGKPMRVENCLFENPYMAIHITSDARRWYESGKVNSLTIKNNVFRGCNYSGGNAAIEIDPECGAEGAYVHSNIVIENNVAEGCYGGFIKAKKVCGLKIINNAIKNKRCDETVAQISLSDCDTVTESGNNV